jgi:hypothetical protein
MSEESVMCQYVYTPAEFRRALAGYRRYSKRRWGMLALGIIVGFVAAGTFLPNGAHPETASSPWLQLLNFVPVGVIFGIFVYAFWFSGQRAFKKSVNYNQTMRYFLSDDGLAVRTPLVESNVRWEIFSRVAENKDGFVLLQKGRSAINWLPKDGFDSVASFARAREIMRRNVPDARKLLSAEAGQAGG